MPPTAVGGEIVARCIDNCDVATIPEPPAVALVLLGGGPWGSAGSRDVPTLAAEIKLARDMLDQGKPVLGIGLGAQILAIASGGGSEDAPLEFNVGYATLGGSRFAGRRSGEIYELYLRPEYHGVGFGRRLFAEWGC